MQHQGACVSVTNQPTAHVCISGYCCYLNTKDAKRSALEIRKAGLTFGKPTAAFATDTGRDKLHTLKLSLTGNKVPKPASALASPVPAPLMMHA